MKTGLRRHGGWCFALALLVTIDTSQSGVASEYRVQPGDQLEIYLAGFSETRIKSYVGSSGTVSVPLLGAVAVAGMTLTEIRSALGSRYSAKPLERRGTDGRVEPVVIGSEDVSVEVSEFRPVYVTGDVRRPGEQAFRPGRTVRQAVAIAGGVGSTIVDPARAAVEAPAAAGELEALRARRLAQLARIWRAKAELGEDADAEWKALQSSGGQDLAQLAARAVTERKTEHDQQVDLLNRLVAEDENRFRLLTEQKDHEVEASKLDAEDYDRVSKLFERGNSSNTRLSDSRRTMLLSATRILQLDATISAVVRDREEQTKAIQALDIHRRTELAAELAEAKASIREIESRIQATKQQLLAYGGLTSVSADLDSDFKITVHRLDAGSIRANSAAPDTIVEPGDVIDLQAQTRSATN